MNWTKIPKQAVGGGTNKFSKYADEICVFVNNQGDIRLSPAADKALGNPRCVSILHDDNGNIGLQASQDDPWAYIVSRSKNERSRHISCQAIMKKVCLLPAKGNIVYKASMVDDVLVINMRQSTKNIG